MAENQPLVQVCCWCLGEFGESLSGESADEVVTFLETIVVANRSSLVTKQYALLALAKLHTRCPAQADRIRAMVTGFGVDHQIDLQQRGVEFSTLFAKYGTMSTALLEKMPVFEMSSSDDLLGGTAAANTNGETAATTATAAAAPTTSASETDLLGGLLGSDFSMPTTNSGNAHFSTFSRLEKQFTFHINKAVANISAKVDVY